MRKRQGKQRQSGKERQRERKTIGQRESEDQGLFVE